MRSVLIQQFMILGEKKGVGAVAVSVIVVVVVVAVVVDVVIVDVVVVIITLYQMVFFAAVRVAFNLWIPSIY